MERPQVKQIETQKVENEREITGYEAEELLRKYGYIEEFNGIVNNSIKEEPQINDLSFEDMLRIEQEKRQANELRRINKANIPNPITFNSNNGFDYKVKYGSDDELGFGFKIEVISDMKIPK